MAEKELTAAQLKEKLDLVMQENTLLKSAGNHDLSWYQKELDTKDKKLTLAEAEINSLKQKRQLDEIEKETIANDRAKEEEQTLGMFNQSEHTRFRLLESPTVRDIFGDVVNPVFDLGVELLHYTGPVQIPVGHVIEMATSIGMLTVEEVEKLQEKLAVSVAKNESAAILGTELTRGISDLVDKFYGDLDSVTAIVEESDEADADDASGESEKSPANESNADETGGSADGDNSLENSLGVSNDSANTELVDTNGTRKLLDEL